MLEIRDLWPEFAIDIGVLKNPVLIKLARWVENFLYRRATHLLVNSPAYRDYLLAKGVPDEKIRSSPMASIPTCSRPRPTACSFAMSSKLGDKFVVTYAGALGMANDIDTILRAAARLRTETRIRILLVGDGKERPNLEAKAKQLELANLMFVGTRTEDGHARRPGRLRRLPGNAEEHPHVPHHLSQQGVRLHGRGPPTILAIDGVIRQVVDAAGGGIFVPPGDDRALAAALPAVVR